MQRGEPGDKRSFTQPLASQLVPLGVDVHVPCADLRPAQSGDIDSRTAIGVQKVGKGILPQEGAQFPS